MLLHKISAKSRQLSGASPLAMEKLKYTLQIWNRLSTHVRVRDRSIKVLQYGCQMLIGFYGKQLTKEMYEGLRVTRSMASTSRKAFWLLKSLNHVESLIYMVEHYEHATDECYVELMDILEQFFLILYYFYENLVFIARTKLVSFTEDSMDEWGDMVWFLEDLMGFLAAFLKSYVCHKRLRIKERLLLCCEESAPAPGGGMDPLHESYKNEVAVGTDRLYDARKELEILRTKYSDSVLSVAIALLELGASAEAINLFKNVLGVAIGDTGMGMCGVASSVLILYEATINAMRAE
eukprot:gene26059-29433_t